MKTYKAIDPILYEGRRYEPESTIDLSDEDAKQLLELGAIAEDGQVETTAPAEAAPAEAAPAEAAPAEPAPTKPVAAPKKGKK